MLFIFQRIWSIFNTRDRAYFILLLFLMAVGALLEILGIGLLVPVVAMVQDPVPLLRNEKIAWFYSISGARSPENFLLMACIGILALFIFKNGYQIFLIWIQNRFLFSRYVRKSRQLFQLYLQRPYYFHINQNSAKLLRNMQIIQPALTNVILPFLYLATDVMIVFAIIVLLLCNNPYATLFASVSLGTVVGVTYLIVRHKLGILGIQQANEQGSMILQIQQALGSMKETRILCRERIFYDHFTNHLLPYSQSSAQNLFIAQLPRYTNETAGVSFVLVLLVLAIYSNRGTTAFITLGLFAIATIRLLPSLSRIGGSLNSIKFYSAHLNEIFTDLFKSKNLSGIMQSEAEMTRYPILHELKFDRISFSYENNKARVLNDVTLTIRKMQTVAFVGPSGSGKTTAVDLLLGLHTPCEGRILVDGMDIQNNIRSWRRNIGYVPQQIYLADASIRQNVAFGIETSEINDKAVLRSLRIAQLDNFVKGLPGGLNAQIGEHGVRLSGGQRQRIGIARALYHDPEILVLDEATAALDNETEAYFMKSIHELSGRKTIIMIAHRLSTVENCDRIFYIKDGTILAEGTYQELVNNCNDFATFARKD